MKNLWLQALALAVVALSIPLAPPLAAGGDDFSASRRDRTPVLGTGYETMNAADMTLARRPLFEEASSARTFETVTSP